MNLRRRSLALLTLALPALPSRAADPDWRKKLTVQIETTHESSQPDHGSGVILCQAEDMVYILTAHHVLFSKKQDGVNFTRQDLKTTRISFFRNLAKEILEDREKGDDLVGIASVAPEKDLLLLRVQVPRQLPATADIGRSPTEAQLAGEGLKAMVVTAVGYAGKSSQSWQERVGKVVQREPPYFLLHDAPIEGGFSGGPLFDDADALIGLNVQIASSGGGEGRALAVEEIVQSISNVLPAGCLQQAEEENSARRAFELYTQALREISLAQWKAAADKLNSAIELKNREGGRIHLEGMRYTEYLPHFQLGLVHYRNGCYQEAYDELRKSEAQRVILDNKRSRRLRRLKEKAFNLRRDQSPQCDAVETAGI